eukprot:5957174-Alexandrium_andersonii.AAC.1
MASLALVQAPRHVARCGTQMASRRKAKRDTSSRTERLSETRHALVPAPWAASPAVQAQPAMLAGHQVGKEWTGPARSCPRWPRPARRSGWPRSWPSLCRWWQRQP